MINQNDTPNNQNESENIIPETSSNKMKTRTYRIICILLFAAGIVFFIFFFDKYHYHIIFNYGWIIISALASILTIVWCFLTTQTKVIKSVVLIIAGIVLAVNWYIYFRYIPKYSLRDACAIVKADPRYASSVIEPNYFDHPSIDGTKLEKRLNSYILEDNPFYLWGYVLDVISDGKVITWLKFDPATGKYKVYEYKD